MIELAGQSEIQVVRGINFYLQCDRTGHHVCLVVERGLRATEFRIFPAEFMGQGSNRQPMKTSTRSLGNYALSTIDTALRERKPLTYQYRGRELFRIRHVDLLEERVKLQTFEYTTSRQRI